MNTLHSPIDILRPLQPRITEGRSSLFEAISVMPPLLRSALETHLRERIERSQGRPMLGEYAPWLVADLLNVDRPSELAAVSLGWQQMCWGVVLLDDIIDDDHSANTSTLLIAAQLLIQRGLCELLDVASSPREIRKSIDDAFMRNASAIADEQKSHRHSLTPFNRPEISALGDKLAVLNVCLDAIIQFSSAPPEIAERVRFGFRKLVAALQLLDDVTDYQDDLRAGNMTYPLTLAAEHEDWIWAAAESAEPVNADQVLCTLISSGALSATLTSARTLLNEALLDVQAIDASKQARCTRYLMAILAALDDSIQLTRKTEVDLREAKRLPESQLEQTMESIRRSLRIVAQSS